MPPKVVITDEHGQTMQDIIGPYDEGSSLSLFCEASDGNFCYLKFVLLNHKECWNFMIVYDCY